MTSPDNPNGSEKLLVCGVCEYVTRTRNEFGNHVQKDHRRELFFWCRWCGTLFSDRSKYTSHEIGDECPRKYQFNHTCGFEGCGYSTGSPTRFVDHIQVKHSGESFIPCAFCKRSFTIPPCLVEHIQIDCCERPPRGSYKKGPDNNWDSDTENDAQRNISVHAKSKFPCQVPPKPVIPSTPIAPALAPRSSPLSSHEKACPPRSSLSFQASAQPTNKGGPIKCSRDYLSSTDGNVPHGQTVKKTVKILPNTAHNRQSEIVLSDSGPRSSFQASAQPTNRSNKSIPVASSGDYASPPGGNVPHVAATGKTAKNPLNTARSKQSEIVLSDSDPDDPSYNPLEDPAKNKRRSVIKTRTSVGPQRKDSNLYFKPKRSSLIFCDNCCVPFYDKLKHLEHVNSNSCKKTHKYTYPCGFIGCKYSTTFPNSFLTHLSNVHSNEQFLPCYNCERTFSIPRCLVEHIQEECSVYVKVATDKRADPAPAHVDSQKTQISNAPKAKKPIETVLPDSEPEDLICDVYDDGVNDSPPSSPEPTPVSLQPAGDKGPTSRPKLQGEFSQPGKKTVSDSNPQAAVPVTRQPLIKETINVEPNVNMDLEILGDIGETMKMPDLNPVSNVETKPELFSSARILSDIPSSILTPENDTKYVPTFNRNIESIETWRAWLMKFFTIKSREEARVFQNSENSQNFFKCMARACHYTCHDRLNFTIHILTSHKNEELRCCYCLSSWTNMDSYLEHMVDDHGQLNFQCSACPYRASSKEHVRAHYKCAHAGMDITIISCPPVTCSESSVCVTIELHKTYNCSWSTCSFRTLVKADFVTHWFEQHPGRHFFGCGYCNYEATSLDMLMQHYSKHRMFTFECDYCPFGSDTENLVVEHICLKHANHKFQMLSRQPEPTSKNILLRKSNSPLLSDRVSSTTSPKRTDFEAQKEKELTSRTSLSSTKARQDPNKSTAVSSRAADKSPQLRNSIICMNTSGNVPQPFPIGMNISSFASSSLPDEQHQIVSSNSVLPMVVKIKQEPVADTETITGDINENLPCLSPVYDMTQNMPVQNQIQNMPQQVRLQDTPVQNTIQNVPVQVGLQNTPAQDILQIAPLQYMFQSTPTQYMFRNSQLQCILQNTQSQYMLQNTPRQANSQNILVQNMNQNMPAQHTAQNKPIQQMVQTKPVQPIVHNQTIQPAAMKPPIQQQIQNLPVQQMVQNKPVQSTIHNRPIQQMALNKPVQQMVQNQPMQDIIQVISTPENLQDTLAMLAKKFPNVPMSVLQLEGSSYNAPTIQITLQNRQDQNMPVLKQMVPGQTTPVSKTLQNTPVPERLQSTPVPERLQSTPVPERLQSTPVPERLQNTPALKTLHNTLSPETLQNRPVPETLRNTPAPETLLNTPAPEILRNTPAPVTFQNKSSPELSQNMQDPETLRNTSAPEMLQNALSPGSMQTTSAPETSQHTSAPERTPNTLVPVAEKFPNVPLPVLEVAQNKSCFDISDLKKILENVQQQITNHPHLNPTETNLGSNIPDDVGEKQELPILTANSETAQMDVEMCNSSALVSKNSQNSYVCLLCHKAHNSRLTAEAHAQNFHKLKDLYKCSVCSFTSPNNFILKHHIKDLHPGTVVSHINLAFRSTKPKKKKTINTELKEDDPLKIPIKIEPVDTEETAQSLESNSEDMLRTGRSLERNQTGQLHTRAGITRFQCNLCSFHCDSKQIEMIRHLASTHNVQSLYKCELCEFQAVTSQTVKKHLQLKHPGGPKKEPISLMYIKTFIPNPIASTSSHDPQMTSPKGSESQTITSPIFIRSSPRSSSSTRTSPAGHLYENSPKSSSVITTSSASPGDAPNTVSYECVFCNYSTSEKSHMVTHLYMEMHYFKYVCVYCNFRGRYPMDVIAHCKRNHSDKPDDVVDTKCNSLVEEWVENYVSAQKQKFDGENILEPCILDAHLEKNYCNMCQTKFPSESLLQEHLFAHLQYRPYRCAICEKPFSLNKEVELHQIAHHNGDVKGSQHKTIKVLEEWIRFLIAQNGCFPNQTYIPKDSHPGSGICVKKEPLEEQESIEGANSSIPNETISKDALTIPQTLHSAKHTELTQKRVEKEKTKTPKSDLKKIPPVVSASNKSTSEKQLKSINTNQKTEEKSLNEASNASSPLERPHQESKVAQKRKGKINTSKKETVSVKTKEKERSVDHSLPSSSSGCLSTDQKLSSKKNEKIEVKKPTLEVRDLPANSKASYKVVKGSALKVKIKKEPRESLDFTDSKSSCESNYLASTSKENPKKRKLKALEEEDKVVQKNDADLSKRLKEADIDLIAKQLIKFTNKTARKSASSKLVSNSVQATTSKLNVTTSPKITNYFKATARKSTSKPPQTRPLPAVFKQTARKSVPGHCQTQPLYYSRYGCKPKKPDFTKLFIMTKPPGSQVGVRLSAFYLRDLFKRELQVRLTDCRKEIWKFI